MPKQQETFFDIYWEATKDACMTNLSVVTGTPRGILRRRYDDVSSGLKTLQRRIYFWLGECLRDKRDLTDVMSGFGNATVPLVMEDALDSLTLLDSKGMYSLTVNHVCDALDLHDRVTQHHVTFGPSPVNLHGMISHDAALLGTGLIFPPEGRGRDEQFAPRDGIQSRGSRGSYRRYAPHARPHVITGPENPVGLQDILRDIGRDKRILHIADIPKFGFPNGVKCSRQHVEDALDKLNDPLWAIDEWRGDGGNPEIVLGKLVHR